MKSGDKALVERIPVTQLKKNAILLGTNRVEVTGGEEIVTVDVRSNVEYDITIKEGPRWIAPVPKTRSLKESIHSFRIDANPADEPRTCVIVFKDKDSELFDELTIVQAERVDPDPERTALGAIYNSLGGEGWVSNGNWLTDKPLSEWHGVKTDEQGHVTALRLSRNNLRGIPPAKISKLTHLKHLDLSWNELAGELDKDYHVGDLTEL